MIRLAILSLAAVVAVCVAPVDARSRCSTRRYPLRQLTDAVTSSSEFLNGQLTESGVNTESIPIDLHEALTANAISTTDFKKDLLKLVNRERTSRKLRPVCLNSKLSLAAQRHANDTAEFNYFSHTGRNGSRFTQRITAAGFKWSSAGEIIAAGQTSAVNVMKAWMNSKGHRAIILGPGYTFVGGGYAYDPTSKYKHYWVQEFGAGTTEKCDP